MKDRSCTHQLITEPKEEGRVKGSVADNVRAGVFTGSCANGVAREPGHTPRQSTTHLYGTNQLTSGHF